MVKRKGILVKSKLIGKRSKSLQNKIIKKGKSSSSLRQLNFRIFHKRKHSTSNNMFLRNRSIVIKTLTQYRLSVRVLEALRKALRRKLFKTVQLFLLAYPYAPVTKRPQEVRMGRGKSKRIVDWVCPLKSAQVIYTISSPVRLDLLDSKVINMNKNYYLVEKYLLNLFKIFKAKVPFKLSRLVVIL
jgi:ribosomal protein L16/L10AE